MPTWATTVPADEAEVTIAGLIDRGRTVLDQSDHEIGWITLLIDESAKQH